MTSAQEDFDFDAWTIGGDRDGMSYAQCPACLMDVDHDFYSSRGSEAWSAKTVGEWRKLAEAHWKQVHPKVEDAQATEDISEHCVFCDFALEFSGPMHMCAEMRVVLVKSMQKHVEALHPGKQHDGS